MKPIYRLAGLFLLLILLSHCLTVKPPQPSPEEVAIFKQLQEAQSDWNRGDYERLAARESTVFCETLNDPCRTLRLLTGMACFRTSRYSCAADQIEKGMDAPQKAFHDLGLDQITVALHLLESLRALWLHEKGDAAFVPAKRLRDAAAWFRTLAPEHPAGPFFWGSAQLVLLRAAIPTTDDPARLCHEFTVLLDTVQKAAPPSSSIRDTTYYRQLLSDISEGQQTVPHCGS